MLMNDNHRNFFDTKDFIFEKCSTLTQDIGYFNAEIITDNSEGFWNVSKNMLDFYWSQYFNKYGVCLQEIEVKSKKSSVPYNEYLKNSVKALISNNFHGMVKVDSHEENDSSWKISASIPPSTLLNCLRYSPYKLENNDIAAEFIIYQIISAVESLHLSEIPHLDLTLDNIYVDENFIVNLCLPNMNTLSGKVKNCSLDKGKKEIQVKKEDQNLENVLWQWMCGKMTNLDYLIYLNKLACRSESDPNNHCMIPWVTDFRVRNGGLRDLKLSKFRINKGDDHLNKIYQDQLEEYENYENECPLENVNNRSEPTPKISINKSRLINARISVTDINNQFTDYEPSFPHHVSDILSELSFYAYMARVTPINILKKSYRSFYNPQEFRWNMTKMYDWTPDECIPEFFTDPSVFRSMHADMPDIVLPEWCNTPEEFVQYHRSILESPEVSAELHHWIDLVFGYKLIGEEAVAAKNVHRQFTDRSPKIANSGLTILFRSPHPKRLSSTIYLKKYFGPERPQFYQDEIIECPQNENIISLPDDYDPMELIEFYKEYCLFIQNSCAHEAVEIKPIKKVAKSLVDAAAEEDIINLCCLIIEIFNFDKLRADYMYSAKDLHLRVQSCLLLLQEDPTRVPLNFRDSVEKIIMTCQEKYGRIPKVFELKRSEKWFLFSKSTSKLCNLIKNLYSPNMDKVSSIKHFFDNHRENGRLPIQTLNLLFPHLIYLLKLKSSLSLACLVCITQRFGLIVGKAYFIKNIFLHIINLYPNEKSLVRSHHALLYQRTFLNILLLRVGMVEFLNNMVEHLIRMLVIGQNVFGSTKETNMPETDVKTTANDTQSLNDFEVSSTWYVVNGDDDNIIHSENRISQIQDVSDGDGISTDVQAGILDPDSVSQSSIDMEEFKASSNKPLNGYLVSLSKSNVLDNLPLSDSETYEESGTVSKGSLTQFLSPFKKHSSSKQKKCSIKSSKIQIRQNMSQDCSKMSLAGLSRSSLIWLADLVGPIQASSRILYELLSQFLVCFQNSTFHEVSGDQVSYRIDQSKASLVTGTYDSCIQADVEVIVILDCFREFIGLYGLAVVDKQFRHFLNTLFDKIRSFAENFGTETEISLVCSLSLLQFLGMVIPDKYLESFLSEKILDDYIPLIIKYIGNMSQPFPSGAKARKVIFHKTIDLIYLLSSRMKYDQIHVGVGNVFKLLFGLFTKIFICDESGNVTYRSAYVDIVAPLTNSESSQYFINFLPEQNDFTIHSNHQVNVSPINMSPSSNLQRQSAFEEMKAVATADLASVIYITFAKLLGQNKLNSLLYNQSLIQALVIQHENDLNKSNVYSSPDKVKQQKLEISLKSYTSSVMAYKKRHLIDPWQRYWDHELGFCDSEPFDIKQMCLGKFEGHNSAVKGFDVLNCENGFLSYGKDKVVKLYSCADIDYSNLTIDVPSKFEYSHKKMVTDAIFIEQMRMAVSLDGLIHLWDPFVGKKIHDTSLGVNSPNWSMVCCVPPACFQIAVANTDGRIQIVDLRSGTSTFSYNLNVNPLTPPPYGDFATSIGVPGGFFRQISGAPNGNHLIIGNSEGFLSIVDLRMSRLLHTLRPHLNEISQIKYMKNWCVTSSLEPSGKLHLFSLSNFNKHQIVCGTDVASIHSLMLIRNQVLVGLSQNRFGVFTSLNQYKSLSRISSTLYKGTVTTASLLLHNNLLLLGNDTGNISLWY